STGTLQTVREIDVSSADLWAQGLRHFESTPLSEVIEHLERYHSVQFTFADPRLKDLRLSGTFRITDLSLILRTLTTALPIEVKWSGLRSVEFTHLAAEAGQDPLASERQQ